MYLHSLSSVSVGKADSCRREGTVFTVDVDHFRVQMG
jgi:hypothetical protein